MKRRYLPLLVTLLLGLCSCGLQEGLASRSDTAAAVGSVAPRFHGNLLDGRSFDSKLLAGRVVVLDFWGSWCAPCQAEQPELNSLAQQFQPRGVFFLGVDLRDDRASAQSFVLDKKVPYGSIFDGDQQITASFDVAAPPTTVVIDSRGRIAGTYLATTSGIASLLDSLIQQQKRI